MFVDKTAGVIAHELGHMLGLRHSRDQYTNDIMNPVQSQNPGAQRFLNVSRQTEDGTYQNAYQELRASFAGQRQMNGYWGGGQPNHDHAHHHEEDGGTAVAFDVTGTSKPAVDLVYRDVARASQPGNPYSLNLATASNRHATAVKAGDALATILAGEARKGTKAAPVSNSLDAALVDQLAINAFA
jgi:hypothetical protein